MGSRILLIEDNPDNMDLMSYLLEAYGHTTLKAWDGEDGLVAAEREVPDLILCDIQLPKLDGFGVCRQLSQSESLKEVPLVAITALAMAGDREKVLAAGFDGYISKPIDSEQFVTQVENFIALKSSHGTRPAPPQRAV